MNSSPTCHEIPGCPGCYVDGFRGLYLKKTLNPNNVFILSHWHGDHYGNLPKHGKYRGPARIHCTPVTAELLRKVHEIPPIFVVEHNYGETWTYQPPRTKALEVSQLKQKQSTDTVRITFYDANHCPGAAIIAFQLPCGKVHLHTGDMRYHEKMKLYPILKESSSQKHIDVVLLDTTYADPKHDFVPQDVAIESVAEAVDELLGDNRGCCDDAKAGNTLVLLSCYSIGKEKILWEASTRTNQKIYVNDKKYRMLQCIEKEESGESAPFHQIAQRCTQDPNQSDIHVIPMGLAGDVWPFFKPNYSACADYAKQLSKQYDKVAAFIPTGWADGSNWNKKNSVSSLVCGRIEVEIRLVSYSEHSSFSELQRFVEFLQPRKIIPTVFKDENDKHKIISRFKIDSTRAKEFFIQSMEKNTSAKSHAVHTPPGEPFRKRKEYIDEMEPRESVQKRQYPANEANAKIKISDVESEVTSLIAMGFSRSDSESAMRNCSGNINAAVEQLLLGATTPHTTSGVGKYSRSSNTIADSSPKEANPSPTSVERHPSSSPNSQKKSKGIKDFFHVQQNR